MGSSILKRVENILKAELKYADEYSHSKLEAELRKIYTDMDEQEIACSISEFIESSDEFEYDVGRLAYKKV